MKERHILKFQLLREKGPNKRMKLTAGLVQRRRALETSGACATLYVGCQDPSAAYPTPARCSKKKEGKYQMRHICKVVIICLLLVSIPALRLTSNAETLLAPHAYGSIQEALDNAGPGDTVLVDSGVYYENIIWPNTQNISLIGLSGPEHTVIDGDSSGSVVFISVGVEISVTVKGFTIRRGYSNNGGGLYCRKTALTLENCVIQSNTAYSWGGGIFCTNCHGLTLKDNVVIDNHLTQPDWSAGGGINLSNCSSVLVENTDFVGNSALGWAGGLEVEYCDSVEVVHCMFEANQVGPGFDAGGGAMKLYQSNWCTVSEDTFIRNSSTFYAGALSFHLGSFHTLNRCYFENNSAGSGAGVDCWNQASPQVEDCTFRLNTASETGGGLTCGGHSDPVVVNCHFIDNSALRGGAVFCWNYADPVLRHLTITGNSAVHYGGGICMVGGSSPAIEFCLIQDNTSWKGGGIDCYASSSPTIMYSHILSNSALQAGDGIYCDGGATPVIYRNNFEDNGEALHNADLSLSVDADSNWWGDDTGPYHPTLNPGGLGDSVSDSVDFIPWLGSPVTAVQEGELTSRDYRLRISNFPNPFNPSTTISFQLPERSFVNLSAYNVLGQLVETLVNEEMSPGHHAVPWHAGDFSSGVYNYRITAGEYSATGKCLLLK